MDDMNRWIMGEGFRVHYTDERVDGIAGVLLI